MRLPHNIPSNIDYDQSEAMDHSNGTGNNSSLARNLHFQSLHLIHAIVMLCALKKDSKCQKV